jgi:DNA polymerase-3 subunit chi
VTQIGFYHLTRTSLEEALPKLLERSLAAGKRALVLCSDEDTVARLDALLWAPGPGWLPHGTDRDGDRDLQPIWLATEPDAARMAEYLFITGGQRTAQVGEYERVFDLFDGNEPAQVAAARERWTLWRGQGHRLDYWSQGERGWEKRAG